jgi:hypothetical protein
MASAKSATSCTAASTAVLPLVSPVATAWVQAVSSDSTVLSLEVDAEAGTGTVNGTVAGAGLDLYSENVRGGMSIWDGGGPGR